EDRENRITRIDLEMLPGESVSRRRDWAQKLRAAAGRTLGAARCEARLWPDCGKSGGAALQQRERVPDAAQRRHAYADRLPHLAGAFRAFAAVRAIHAILRSSHADARRGPRWILATGTQRNERRRTDVA